MIKAVFFDFDGVITPDPSGTYTTCLYISKITGQPLEKLVADYKLGAEERNLGTKPLAESWDDFWEHSGITKDNNLLTEAFLSTPRNEKMIELVLAIKKDGYKTGIITDNNLLRWELLEKAWGLKKMFDSIIVSSQVHLDKYTSGTKIFEVAVNSLGLAPEEAIFIDNNKKNSDMATSSGMRGYFHDEKKNDIDALIQFLKNLGVEFIPPLL